MSKSSKFTKSLTNLIMYILFAALILALLSGVYYLLNTPVGIYIVYGDQNITSDNSGITLEWDSDESAVTFAICNSDDWGAYSVKDCTVKVIAKVSDENDFEFTVNGTTGLFSRESDLTAAFTADYTSYSGSGFTITDDGEFTLYLIPYTADYAYTAMSRLLSRVYGGVSVAIAENVDIVSNVYFALEITSPDGGTSFTVPIGLSVSPSAAEQYSVRYRLSECVADESNVKAVVLGGGATLKFTSNTGYDLADSITVTGAMLDSWDSTTGTAVISKVTGTITVYVDTVLTSYSVTFYSRSTDYLLSYSPQYSEMVIGYVTIESTLTITLTADDDHYITTVTVYNADIEGASGNVIDNISVISYTFTILNPSADVVVRVGYMDRDL